MADRDAAFIGSMSEPMLAYARTKPFASALEWRQADGSCSSRTRSPACARPCAS